MRKRYGQLLAGAALIAGTLAVGAGRPAHAWTSGEPTIALVSGGTTNIAASARDASGNIVVVGSNATTAADFDPSAGTASVDANRGFVAKYDPTGALLWVGMFGQAAPSNVAAAPYDVAIDESTGDIFVVGSLGASADLDPGSGTATFAPVPNLSGWGDGFIVRLNTAGEYEAASNYGGPNSEWFTSIALSGSTLFVAGTFANGDFNGSSTSVTKCGPSGTLCTDVNLRTGGLIGKVNATTLEASWLKSMTADYIYGATNLEVEVDASKVYVLGETGRGDTDLNPAAGLTNVANFKATGSKDAYWVVLDHDGAYVRSGGILTSGSGDTRSNPTGLGVDADGNVYLTAATKGSTATINNTAYPISTNTSSVLVRLSSTGTVSRVTMFTDRVPQALKVVGTDLFVTGNDYSKSADGFAYVEKLSGSGTPVWRNVTGMKLGSSLIGGIDLSVESDGSVWATGRVRQGSVTLDTCAGKALTNSNASAWLMKTDKFGAAEDVPELSWPSSSIEIAIGVENSVTLPISCDRGTVWALADGSSLPAGLSLDPTTGKVSGTPTESGSYDFTIVATNAKGSTQQKFAGTMVPPRAPSWSDPNAEKSLGDFASGGVVNSVFVTAGGLPAPTYALAPGSTLPNRLTLNEQTGEITGDVLSGFTYSFSIVATNVAGSATQTFTGKITPAKKPSWTQTAPSLSMTVGTQFTASFPAAGPPAPRYTVSAGTLPAGLSLNTRTGTISGTPKTAGDISFTITATNSAGSTDLVFSGTVAPSSDADSSTPPPGGDSGTTGSGTNSTGSAGTSSGGGSTATSTTVAGSTTTAATQVTTSAGRAPSRAEVRALPVSRLVTGGQVESGETYAVVASGFTPGETVNAFFEGSSKSLGVSKASATGSARVAVRIPPTASGKKTLVLFGATSRKGVRQSIIATGGADTLPATGGSTMPLVWLSIALVGIGTVTRRRLRA